MGSRSMSCAHSAWRVARPCAGLRGLVDSGTSSLDPPLVPQQVDRLMRRQGHQERPKVVAVMDLRELPLAGPRQKLLNALERHILLIGRSPRRSLELDPRQLHHPSVIDIPELSRGLRVPSLELPEPEHDRIISIHNQCDQPGWHAGMARVCAGGAPIDLPTPRTRSHSWEKTANPCRGNDPF